jgi:hypothetical protein
MSSSGSSSSRAASTTASPCAPPAMTAWYRAPCGLMYLEKVETKKGNKETRQKSMHHYHRGIQSNVLAKDTVKDTE